MNFAREERQRESGKFQLKRWETHREEDDDDVTCPFQGLIRKTVDSRVFLKENFTI